MPHNSGSIFSYRNMAHVIGWLVFILAPVLMSPIHEIASHFTDPRNLLSLLLRNLFLMALFYFNLRYLTPVVLPRRGVAFFAFSLLALIILFSMGYWVIHEAVTGEFWREFRPRPAMPPPDFMDPGRPRRPVMLAGPYFASFLITTLVAGASTLIVLWNNWIKAQENEKERTYQKVAAELSVLKLQISPHFLFNTLNNIRWLVRSRSDHAETAVVKLSHLLRYVLYQTNHDRVPLDKEIDHLKDYVTLQQLRLANSASVSLTVKGDPEGKVIVPLLLIPLVENFFKHGDFEASVPNSLLLVIRNDQLVLKIENSIAKNAVEKEVGVPGIGLENVKKRLALHYPDHHHLEYFEKDGRFHVNLEIILI